MQSNHTHTLDLNQFPSALSRLHWADLTLRRSAPQEALRTPDQRRTILLVASMVSFRLVTACVAAACLLMGSNWARAAETTAEVLPDGTSPRSERHPFMEAQAHSDAAAAARRKLRQWAMDGEPSKPTSNTPPVQSSGGSHDHHGHKHGHQCIHDMIIDSLGNRDHPASRPSHQNYGGEGAETDKEGSGGRKLSSGSEFQAMRIYLDTSSLDFSAANP